MWNKIYLIALALAVLVMSSLSFYSYTWLQSPTKPADVTANYDYYSGLAWMFLWISSIILLILANALLWKTGKSWALWTTLLYFAFFILFQTFWLDNTYSNFKNLNGYGNKAISLTPFLGVILCVIGAVIVFFDQFLVNRMQRKMFNKTTEKIEPASENVP